jgi:translocation and assembly module TamB
MDKLKGELGIDAIDIQAGTAATGTSETSPSVPEEVQRSLVTLGKYLTPQLYISYGYSVFTNEQLLTLRYQISRQWEIETRRGNELGVDLYYRINFY